MAKVKGLDVLPKKTDRIQYIPAANDHSLADYWPGTAVST